MTAPADTPDAGLVHLGILYDDVDDLVARSLPEIRKVLGAGGDVLVTVDRGGVRRFREVLGADADRVSFPSPQAAFGESTPDFLRTLRTWARPDRRTMVLGQYSRSNPTTWDCAFAEDAVNLVLGDLPMTVLCACERTGAPDHQALTVRSHATLVGDGRRVPNPDFRAPASSMPAPLGPWGEPVLSTTVGDSADLSTVRRQVRDVAALAGLHGDARASAVLAVHEAILLAGDAGLGEMPALPLGLQEVRVRVAGDAMVTEVLGASTDEAPAADTTTDTDDPWADLRRASLSAFCDRVTVHDGPGGRLVRVVSTRRQPA